MKPCAKMKTQPLATAGLSGHLSQRLAMTVPTMAQFITVIKTNMAIST